MMSVSCHIPLFLLSCCLLSALTHWGPSPQCHIKGEAWEGAVAGWAVTPVAPCLCADLLWLCRSSQDQSTSLRERWEGKTDHGWGGPLHRTQHTGHRTLPRAGRGP